MWIGSNQLLVQFIADVPVDELNLTVVDYVTSSGMWYFIKFQHLLPNMILFLIAGTKTPC